MESEGEIFDDLSSDGEKEFDSDHRRYEDNRDKSRERRSRDHRDYKYKSKGRDNRRWSNSERRRSRDSSHGRHDKRRYKHKSSYRRHSSSDSRSSSRSRRRSRSRRTRSRSRSYDSYASSNDSRADYSDYYGGERGNQDRTHDSYKHQEPNSTIMVRGLASHLTEQDIRQDILKCGIMVKDIRLIRHRDTGASRGFAFVEFQTVQEATRWMDMKMGSLVLQDEYHATLIYSVPKVPYNEKTKLVMSDWYCIKCQGHNFKRRDFCYKCHNPRPDEQDPELCEEFSPHPTNTIILYNLDALTTEEGILQAFKSRSTLASIPIRSVRIAREAVTNLSRGMCFVETNNVTDSVRLYTLLTDDTLTVDSRQAGVAYSKPASHGSSSSSSVAATALAAAQWTNSDNKSQVLDENSIESMAQYSASLYAKTPEEHASYLEYYRNYYRKKHPESDTTTKTTPGTSQNSGVACSSQSSAVIKSSSGSFASDTRSEEKKTAPATINNAPDTSTYQYDEVSGYYYDPVSGLYYDATTQYFYDSTKQQFLYWNTEQGKYVVVSDNTLGSSSSQNSESSKKNSNNDKKKEKKSLQKQDKVLVAKKIAKDMEKWAKTLNQKKDGTKFQTTYETTNTNYVPYYSESSTTITTTTTTTTTTTADTLYSYRAPDSYVKPSTSSQDNSAKTSLVAPYGDESDSDDDTRNASHLGPPMSIPESLIDFQKLACLLCKRQFPNKEVLGKHVKLSELHKKNLEELKKSNYSSLESSSSYRDRAKERRMKFGSGSDPSDGKNTLKDLYIQTKNNISLNYTEEPTKDGLKQDNIGHRMLQKMGWDEGQGLGRDNHGRTSIITAERRAANAGLGLRSIPVVDEGDDRYGRARKLTLARWNELAS